ncbi:hypothetical protein Cs7R123_16830 [Catellatospora sp. TT07R-123]|uniref:hypothetical protein n=1 Tax=Catellatospora sp. TT07R-123 TaxID=2733863 RepID=UPI001B117C93|nr:hypothetical protein [Catellatospora sp. TT07R-123]GHJ44341.1 hypothetical protein Cs7R123_16830 [Catellatospora sp. TT07R-123]
MSRLRLILTVVPWWQLVLLGLAAIGGAAYLYDYLDQQEHRGGMIMLPSPAMLLYAAGGKTLLAGVTAGLGAALIGYAAWRGLRARAADRVAAVAEPQPVIEVR